MPDPVVESFLDSFQLLTPKQQKIWRYLQTMAQKFRNVFPSHATIAESVGCHRETVIEAIKKFNEWGWLGQIKRFWRSTSYYLHDALIKLNLTDPRTFAKRQVLESVTGNPTGNPTENPTPTNRTSSTQERNVEGSDNVHRKSDGKKEHVHREIRNLGLSWRDMVLLSKYSLHVIRLAVEDYQTYRLMHHVRNLPAFLMSRCQAYIIKLKGQPCSS